MKKYAILIFVFMCLVPSISQVDDEDYNSEDVMENSEFEEDSAIDLNSLIRKDDKNRVRKYPARLWMITGNGLKKPSYLYGTMHVSKKLAFNLGDTFYKALNNVDVVALELAIDSWFSNIGKNQANGGNQESEEYSYGNYYSQGYKDVLRFNKFNLDRIVYAMGSSDYMSNFLLYRKGYGSADHSEKTYVDLYIHQVGKKLGKYCTGLEDFETSDRMVSRSDWRNRTYVTPKRTGYDDGYYGGESEIEKAYREGDLDLIDSLDRKQVTNKLYNKWMLDVRNRVMANSIHNIAPTKSIFAAVGCAHLPGDSGVIEMLRGMGYTLTPIPDNVGDYAFKQKLKLEATINPVNLQVFKSTDGELEIELPGQPILRGEGNNEQLFYADVSNGAYYVINKIPYYGVVHGVSQNELIRKVDSALYENIPGDITEKQKVKISGYPALLVTNKTKLGESQRHVFIALPNHIWYAKINATGEYAFSKDVNKIIKSIKVNTIEQEWTTYEPESGGVKLNWPCKVLPHKYSFDTSTNYSAVNPLEFSNEKNYYFMNVLNSFGYDKQGDTFHFENMVKNLAYYTSYTIEKTESQNIQGRYTYHATLRAKDKSQYLHLLLVPYLSRYLYIGVYTHEKSVPNKFLSSFEYTPFKYKYLPKNYTDKETGLTYKTTNQQWQDYKYNYIKEEKEYLKADIIYPSKYSSSAYFFSDSLKDSKSTIDNVYFPTGESVDVRFTIDNKMAPREYNYIIRKIKDRKGDLYTNYKNYLDSAKKAEENEKNKRQKEDNDTKITYEIGDLDIVLLDTIYRQNNDYIIEKKETQIGNHWVNYTKSIWQPHQNLEFKTDYNLQRGLSAPVLDVMNSYSIPTDKTKRLDSNQLAEVLLKLMDSKDTIDFFRLTDYQYEIADMPRAYNDRLYDRLIDYSNRTKSEYIDIAEEIENKLLEDQYPKLMNYYLYKYAKAGDTSELQVKYLDKLAMLKNKKALDTMIYWLIEETPLKPEESYNSYMFSSLINNAYDSLKLWAPYFKKLLPLRRYDEYGDNVMSLGVRLLDSNLIAANSFEPILDDLILSFRDNLKRKMSVKQKNSYYANRDENDAKYEAKDYDYSPFGNKRNTLFINYQQNHDYDYDNYEAYDAVEAAVDYGENLNSNWSYSNPIISHYGAYKTLNHHSISSFTSYKKRNSYRQNYYYGNSGSSSSLIDNARFLMRYYKTNPDVQNRLNRTLKIQNLSDKMDFVEVLMDGGATIPDSIHALYLNKDDYRFGYYKLLLNNNLQKKIPKLNQKEEALLRDFAYYHRWNSSDTVVYIGAKTATIENEKGKMHFFKYRSKKPDYNNEPQEWKISYIYIAAQDSLSKFKAPRYYNFQNDVPKNITFNEFMDNQVEQLKYWNHPYWAPLIPEDEEEDRYNRYRYY